MYAILDGRISRPPEWEQVVEPLVRACTDNDERVVAIWRRQHDVLVEVYYALRHQDRQHGVPRLAGVARVAPAQLPADVDVFTGRVQELADLDRLLANTAYKTAKGATGGGSTAVVISAVSGTAGVGKTALALRWAHRVKGKFPDGQLYVNLRGYDPDQPMSAGDALAGFLRALGLTGQDIPLEVEERAAAYRSLLDGRRMLVVLDNAASVEQIRPLLPGTASCLVIVTSRDSLSGLVARHGARRLDLDLLPPEDAVALLRALIGERVEVEPEAAAKLARLCARLPLALRVAAELAATRPTSLARLVRDLADEQRWLELLDAGGDPRTAVRGVFSWSYRHLSAGAARAFRLLGLHPGPDFDPYATAALTDISLEQAQHMLDVLTRAHLIGPMGSGRYGMHDLLRAYAIHLTAKDSKADRQAALTCLFDYYMSTAAAAVDILVPGEQRHQPRIPPPATPRPPVVEPAAARVWLNTERATLAAACAYAAAHGWPGHTTRLATTLSLYLETGGHLSDALAIHTHALHAARQSSDRSAEAHALTNLGTVYWRQGRYQQAADHLQQALDLCREIGHRDGEIRSLTNLGLVHRRQGLYQLAADHFQHVLALSGEIGDRTGEAHALTNLGAVYRRQGCFEQAADHLQHALALCLDIGDRVGEARALGNLGVVHGWQGRYQLGAEHLQRALTVFREIGHRAGEAHALDSLGLICGRQGGHRAAVDYHQQALALSREIGDRVGEARALGNLGTVYRRQGRYQPAADHYQQALALSREIGHRAGESRAHNGLGETLLASGDPDQVAFHHSVALTLATEIGDRYEQARAHNGLAHTHHATGNPDQARHHWREALTLYTGLDVPDADDVHTHLTTLDQAADDDNGR